MTKNTTPVLENHAAQEHKFTTCYMCACRCGARVTLEDGKIRFVEGNANHPVNRGVLCAKGNAAIMKQYSPAKLQYPMMRKPDSPRGSGEFVEISWEKAMEMLTSRLAKIRSTNPNQLAFFTGRDQMQALSGLWAQQFGTLNWAAHGGFCSVNMAAAGLITHGYSFWEFGEPDWEQTNYFMLWGVAEDHASNPIKIGLKKLKERGVKIVAINPVRTGYQAIADEWIAIKPGGDGALAMALSHVLLHSGRVDEEFLRSYTNMTWLVDEDGLFVRDEKNNPLLWCQNADAAVSVYSDEEVAPVLCGEYTLPDGRYVRTAMTLAMAEYLSADNSPEAMALHCGVDAKTIRRLADELAQAAFAAPVVVNTPWTDWRGKKHDKFVGRAVSMHAMRGVSAHSNGFQTCRSLHFLQALLGSLDCPGGHLAKPPYPKHPPAVPPPAKSSAANTPLNASPLGMPRAPEDLAIDENGNPLRIDHAFSWDAPLSAHGAMHLVIENAGRQNPYPIDTLMIFMANMAWNSAMNPDNAAAMLSAKDDKGDYKIPFVVVADAFHSETVNYADLVLPDTTYLERHDTISLLDRPISEPHAVCDAVRTPVVKTEYNTRPWQEVLVELAARLKLPAFVKDDGTPRYAGYEDFIIHYEKSPGIGFLAGWRGDKGECDLRGKPNIAQWQKYEENESFYRYPLPPATRYFRFANRDYLKFACDAGWIADEKPMFIQLYSEILRKFQRAGESKGDCVPPTEHQRRRLRDYCRPIPFFYPPLEADTVDYPFYAVTQRPMFMYHSWDSQNAWLRQIAADNHIYINRTRATEMRIADDDWVWISSRRGRVAARVRCMEGTEKNTVWTWNAIGKRTGTWGLAAKANESVEGFLMNHLLDEWMPPTDDGAPAKATADPITGQAAWYDLRVNIIKMSAAEVAIRTATIAEADAEQPPTEPLRYIAGKAINLRRSIEDVLKK
ncbi:MAG: molybdopterin-dependent oxidoreductase [Gammaproteobacteria bacterium WSBS_2016_MAG_OTU1]